MCEPDRLVEEALVREDQDEDVAEPGRRRIHGGVKDLLGLVEGELVLPVAEKAEGDHSFTARVDGGPRLVHGPKDFVTEQVVGVDDEGLGGQSRDI